MDAAVDTLSESELTAASPYFHSDHLVGALAAAAAAGDGTCAGGSGSSASSTWQSLECDWCGKQQSRAGGSSKATGSGCDTCGCAWYCSGKCAAAAAPLHARNCWKLERLAVGGAVLKPVSAHKVPMFAYT